LSNGIICLDFKNIVFQDIEISNQKIKSVILLIISLYCKTVWLNGNVKKFEKKNVNSNKVYLNFLTIFLKSKQIMPLDKANIQFLINTNSCELKVHSKNKCLKVSTSLQYTHSL
jgi:hypothetical protein